MLSCPRSRKLLCDGKPAPQVLAFFVPSAYVQVEEHPTVIHGREWANRIPFGGICPPFTDGFRLPAFFCVLRRPTKKSVRFPCPSPSFFPAPRGSAPGVCPCLICVTSYFASANWMQLSGYVDSPPIPAYGGYSTATSCSWRCCNGYLPHHPHGVLV